MAMVTKLALAEREEWVQQGREVPPKEQFRSRSSQQVKKRTEKWERHKKEREDEEYWRSKIAERDRKTRERKEREGKEREERERKKARERLERQTALEVERLRRQEIEKREKEREQQETRERLYQERNDRERNQKKADQREREKKESEEHDKLERERKEYEERVREQEETDDDTLSVFENVSFHGSGFQRSHGSVNRYGENRHEVGDTRRYLTVQAKKDIRNKQVAEQEKIRAKRWFDSQPQHEKDRINAAERAKQVEYHEIEREIGRVQTRGERFYEKLGMIQEEQFESDNGGVGRRSTEDDGADCSGLQPHTANSAVTGTDSDTTSCETDFDGGDEDDGGVEDDGGECSGLQPGERDRDTSKSEPDFDHPNTGLSDVSDNENEEDWKDESVDILSNLPKSREHMYRGFGKATRKGMRRMEREGTVEGSEADADNSRVVGLMENYEAKYQFLKDVVTNTFDFGGGSERRDDDGERYTYRTIKQICGTTSISNETLVLEFCKKHEDLFKVTGEQVELVRPGRKPRTMTVPMHFYTWVPAMKTRLAELIKKEKVFGFDGEFYSYNIYDEKIFDRYKASVQKDIDRSRAEVTTSQIIGKSKHKSCKQTGRPRLAVARGIRLVQIYSSDENMVYLFYLKRGREHQTLIDSGLRDFFQDENITKFVVGNGDVELLQHRHFVKCAGFVDLQQIASACIRDVIPISSKLSLGSNTMAISCGLDMPLFTSCKQLCSDPENKTVGCMFDCLDKPGTSTKYRNELLQYAAYDAYVAMKVGHHLLEELKPSTSSQNHFQLH